MHYKRLITLQYKKFSCSFEVFFAIYEKHLVSPNKFGFREHLTHTTDLMYPLQVEKKKLRSLSASSQIYMAVSSNSYMGSYEETKRIILVSSVMKDHSHLRSKAAVDLVLFLCFFVVHFKSLLQVHLTIKQKQGLRDQLKGLLLSLHILSLSSYSYPGCSTSTS